MAYNNPPVPWSTLEQRLSGRRLSGTGRPPGAPGAWPGADGGDSPAWSRRRQPYAAPPLVRRSGVVPYAELHCHSNFSFLDGASHPEELAEEAVRLGLEALALTDHDGFYGVVRFAEAARAQGLPTVFGAELTLDLPGLELGAADPGGHHLVVLARDPEGYARLGAAISRAQMAGEKGAPRCSLDDLAGRAGGHWLVLTGCRKGMVPRALTDDGPQAAAHELARLVEAFGRDHVAVELWDHGDPLDSPRNDALVQLALRAGVDPVATNNVHYATPARRPLATALSAVRARRSLDEIDGWLPAGAGAHLRSGAEQARRFARYPGVVARAAEMARACAFDLALVAPRLPDFAVPPGHTEMSWLRELAERGAAHRYGPRPASIPRPPDHSRGNSPRIPTAIASSSVPSTRPASPVDPGLNEKAWRQIDHELDMIERLGFPGYFLIVWDIVEFCRRSNIYCQGRGSAANSAVCFAIGVTKADAVRLGLLFERFLSPERDGPPDIDLDIESDRREEAIQYVYERYGRENAAQVANVITYRAKSAVRDMAKALGYATGQQDAWSKQVSHWEPVREAAAGAGGEGDAGDAIPAPVLDLAQQVEHFPRHLGIHSGGMVICDRPVVEVCPVEWGRMADRSVLQWDKDDCAAVGLVKFDLLGLGMLTALHLAIDLVAEVHGEAVDLAEIPQDDAVYDMLCRADSIGVFQVESRAQMATLPRLRPRTFYDLVVEVALIRPGPIQGGSVHPYIRRRNGKEPVTYLHPLLERSLGKTLGVPLFQEQLMSMAIDVAGFTAGEADELRQAMGSKRSRERMERLASRLYAGMAERGITGTVADEIYDKLAAFANFGFPESHSVSFAYLVYASAWLKRYYPAAFCAALLNAQPMGFYSPHSLVQDARRHGVEVRGPDVNASAAAATLEPPSAPEKPHTRGNSARYARAIASAMDVPPAEWGDGGPAVRLGISSVRHIGDDLAERIAAGRPYVSMEDLARRSGAPLHVLEALATAGAFGCFGPGRRPALWGAGAVAQTGADRLDGIVTGVEAPALPLLTAREEAHADLWSTGIAADGHPTRFLRDHLDARGVVPAARLPDVPDGARVLVAGVVTHRQRPATASGTTFVNLEDETGLVNVICSKGCWARYRRVAVGGPALLVRGRLEKVEGVVNVIADKLEVLPLGEPVRSRDFR